MIVRLTHFVGADDLISYLYGNHLVGVCSIFKHFDTNQNYKVTAIEVIRLEERRFLGSDVVDDRAFSMKINIIKNLLQQRLGVQLNVTDNVYKIDLSIQ